MTGNRYAVLSGNAAMAMGGAAAGVKFYCAYPMSPSTGVLHWMAAHARKAGIMVRQVEDEIGVINMAIGAAHAGVRAMCATSGGGFALMSEGLGLSAMMETPVVVIDCQARGPVHRRSHQDRAGRSLADAGRGLRRLSQCASLHRSTLATASSSSRRSSTSPTASSARASCSAICCSSEGRLSVDPKDLDFDPAIDRGELITKLLNGTERTETASTSATRSPKAVSRRAPFPASPAIPTLSASDEHDEDGVLISDEFTNPTKRRAMMEKRMRKVPGLTPPFLRRCCGVRAMPTSR